MSDVARLAAAVDRLAAAVEKLAGIPAPQSSGFRPGQIVGIPIAPSRSLRPGEHRSRHAATWQGNGLPPVLYCAARVNATPLPDEAVPAEQVRWFDRCRSPGCESKWPAER